jgi:hypothetical protein
MEYQIRKDAEIGSGFDVYYIFQDIVQPFYILDIILDKNFIKIFIPHELDLIHKIFQSSFIA